MSRCSSGPSSKISTSTRGNRSRKSAKLLDKKEADRGPMLPMRSSPRCPRPASRAASIALRAGENTARFAEEYAPSVGEPHAAWVALSSRSPIARYSESGDSGRVCKSESVRGAAETQLFGDRDEIAQMAKLHEAMPRGIT